MKYFITLIVVLTVTQFALCAEYFEESDGDILDDVIEDDADPNAGFEVVDEEPKPIYNLDDAPKLFEKYIKDYGKKYKNGEDKAKHYKIFVANIKEINAANSDKERSSTSDINLFTDLAPEERSLYGGIADY